MKQGATLSLPKGWVIKKLGEVCRFINGRAYAQHELLKEGKYPVLRVGNFYTNRDWYYSDLELPEDKYCEKGDLLYAWSASFGPRIWDGEKVIYHYHIWKIEPNEKLIRKDFLFQLLEWDTEALKTAHGTGTTMMHVGKGSIEKRLIPLPPLPEQQRIVSILDECFAAIDKAKANAEQNLKNARELFESVLQLTMDNGKLKIGDGWEERKLIEVFELKPQKKEARDKLKETDLVTFLPMEDLGVLNKEIVGVKERKLKDVSGSYTYFAENDVLLAKITPCFENGKIGIARNLINGVGFGSSEYIVFRSQGSIEPEYLYYFLSRNHIREEGRKYMSGAVGHKRVSKEWIENYLISFPKSKGEQQTIVRQLDALRAETQKLEAIYQQKLLYLEELKKSVLQKAFAGELRSPEGAEYPNDGHCPSDKKKKTITSPERA